jgi:putative ABC transport system substrate-binding protein
MRRREFIAGLGSAAAWPVVARAQDRLRRVGMLWGLSENDPEAKSLFAVFTQELARLGWVEDRNVWIDRRWTNDDSDLAGKFAKELVGLQPDVILAVGALATASLQRETRTIPIVFALASHLVDQGFVADLPRPGGNLTGFGIDEPTFMGKLAQMLKEISPGTSRVAFMYHPDFMPQAKSFLGSLGAAAQVLAVDPVSAAVRTDAEIETAIDALGREQGGLVFFDPFVTAHRATIIAAAARNKVPTINNQNTFPRNGGLMSYGASRPDMFRGTAGYVARILKGDKPAELAVQLPTRYELVINLKTAKALGLTIPETLLATADEVIQ